MESKGKKVRTSSLFSIRNIKLAAYFICFPLPVSYLYMDPMKNKGMLNWNSKPFTRTRSPTVAVPA
jgi:hypothetical protein